MPVPGSGMKEANRGADSSRGRAGSETLSFFQYGNDSTDDESGFHSHRGGQHRPDHSLPRGLFWKAYERSAFAVCSQVRGLQDHEEGFEDARRGAFGLHRVSRGERERRVRGFGVHFARAGPGGLRRSAGCRCRGVRGLEGRAAIEEAVRRTKTAVAAVDADVAAADVAATDSASGHLPEERMRSPSEAESRPGDALRRGRFLADGGLPGRRSAEGIQSGRETPLECMMFLSGLKK